jgi:ring-1,2-phenylacetyl-CoA epoxidase subunit PaaD
MVNWNMPMRDLTPETIWAALDDVKDPEIPVVSVVEMGIVRDVIVADGRVTVTITPTFSGCPALHTMQEGILSKVRQLGADQVEIRVVFSPVWTTEWIAEPARDKLRAFGLTPPPRHDGDLSLALLEPVVCPYCGSKNTSIRNSFGPTLCRAILYCNACQQPFEQFKPL